MAIRFFIRVFGNHLTWTLFYFVRKNPISNFYNQNSVNHLLFISTQGVFIKRLVFILFNMISKRKKHNTLINDWKNARFQGSQFDQI